MSDKIGLTNDMICRILQMNEGYEDTTHYSSRNYRETNHYTIRDGKLHKHSQGKTSWSDSRFDDSTICDIEQVRRFLRPRLNSLKLPE